MKRNEIASLFADTEALLDKSLTVCGWVRTLRQSKSIGFIELNDGSCQRNLQVIIEADKLPNFEQVGKVNVGSALCVEGILALTPEAKQPFELKATAVSIEGPSTPEYPLQKKRHSLEYLRSVAHLRPRTNTFNAVFRVRSVCAYAIHQMCIRDRRRIAWALAK